MKDINEMSERELLMELVMEKRNREKLMIIGYAVKAAILLVIVIGLIMYIPKIVSFVNEINEIKNQINQINENMKNFSTNNNIDFSKLQEYFEQLQGALGIFGLTN